jgi:Bardet-Biedl syndrome 2 protein
MLPAFQVHLHQPVLERVAQVGKFDGRHAALACGTTAGKVFLHSPNEQSDNDETLGDQGGGQQRVRFLKINRRITALAAGKFQAADAGDSLVVGTQASLLAYNIDKNSDIFYKDVPDGVHTMLFAPVPSLKTASAAAAPARMIVVGGNCSLQGFGGDGSELFWTVTGDNVRALALGDMTGHGREELIVGSDDYEIRAFQNEELMYECTETSALRALTPIPLAPDKPSNLFGYALDNGTVGVYKGKSRAWRVKSKNIPVAIQSFDVNGDGDKEIVIGWNNGKFEARKVANGEVVHREVFSSPVAAMVSGDYRMDGNDQLICCSADGEIRGFVTPSGDFQAPVSGAPSTTASDKAKKEEREVAKLSKLKADLQLELKSLESTSSKAGGSSGISVASLSGVGSSSNSGGSTGGKSGKPGGLRIRADTHIKVKSAMTKTSTAFELMVSTENEHVIKMVVLYEYDAGLFEGESLVVRPATMASSVTIPLSMMKHTAAKLDIKVLVGSRGNNSSFHVFDAVFKVPKFAVFHHLTGLDGLDKPKGSVKFKSPLKTHQMVAWVDNAFALAQAVPESVQVSLFFRNVRDGNALIVNINANETEFCTDDMELAAELVQHMCSFLEWRELDSVADFPRQMEDFRALLVRVDECNAIRLKLTGEMADDSNQVKNLVIRVEDARILNDMYVVMRILVSTLGL